MAPIMRKFHKGNTSEDTPRLFHFSLSTAALAVIGVVLTAAVGWAFFMGFMVGRGQNPEKGVEQMTGMLRDKPAAPTAQTTSPGTTTQTTPAGAADAATTAGAAAGSAAGAGAGTAAPAPGAASGSAAQAAAQAGTTQGTQTPGSAYPFSRPDGPGMAAWGVKEAKEPGAAAAPKPGQTQLQAQTGGQAQTAQAKAPERKAPQFDYVFQAAAFKGKADADKLRSTLEGRGLRTQQKKSGKVLLVLVNVRGSEDDARNLREELRRMKLGTPMQLSKKPVAAKKAKR